MSTYVVVIERADDGGYGAWCPDLPGCVALGDSETEVIAEMKEAVQFHIDGLRAEGLAVPPPTTVSATTVTAEAA